MQKFFARIILKFIANHNGIFRELLQNTTRHNLLNTFRKKISNQAIFNESGKTKTSEKIRKSRLVGNL